MTPWTSEICTKTKVEVRKTMAIHGFQLISLHQWPIFSLPQAIDTSLEQISSI